MRSKSFEQPKSKLKHQWSDWLPLSPVILFSLGFQLIPIISVVLSSFSSKSGFTLSNYERAFTPMILNAFVNSIKLSLTTATLGVILGTLTAYALISLSNQFIKNALIALADVTTNFGGAPLAFAFIIILGSTGVITVILKEMGINLYPKFRIYSISGLTIAYLYFQIPLMIMLILPSLLGLKKELWEAANNLGATTLQYWWNIALPILFPALLSSFFILFVNAFGAYATAWTLTGPDVNLITVQIAALIRGEVQLEIELADALSVISMCVALFGVFGYLLLTSKSRRILT